MKRIVWYLLLISLLVSCSRARYAVINTGVGGNSSSDLLLRIDSDVIGLQPDLVILLVGTNDMVNSKKFISYPEFSSNCRALIQKLKALHVTVVLMSPPPVDTTYLFQRHNRKTFTELPNVKLDSAGRILADLAKQYDTEFIDLYRLFEKRLSANEGSNSLILNERNSGRKDGVHPTREGYMLIANEVYKLLEQKKLLRKNRRIVCFGDSITFGAFMEGSGTAEGETYPAFLKSMISGR